MWGRRKRLQPVELDAAIFDEISLRLTWAGVDHKMVDGMLVLDGVGLVRSAAQVKSIHRPIRGKAPGAIS